MSVNTLVKDGILTDIGVGVKIVPVDAKAGEVPQDTMWYSWQWETPPNRVELHA